MLFSGKPDAAFTTGAVARVNGVTYGKGKGLTVESFQILEAAPQRPGAARLGEVGMEVVVARSTPWGKFLYPSAKMFSA